MINEQKQALERINGIKDKAISVLSHDIRSPLASLQGVLDLFDQDVFDAETACTLIQNLRPQFQNTQKLLGSVLEWVKAQNRGEVVQWSTFAVDEVVQKSLAWVQASANAKEVNLVYTSNPNLWIKSDAKIIEFVLRNLLANAVKFTSKDDRVMVRVTPMENGKIRLGVQDTGVGISEADMKKILAETGGFSTAGTAREKVS